MAEFRNSFSYSFKYVGQVVDSPSFISFSIAGAAAGDCGSITVNSDTNEAYFQKTPMTQDANHPMSLLGKIDLLGVDIAAIMDVEMKPFINQPASPADIYYLVTATPGKTETLTYSRHTGQTPFYTLKLYINNAPHDNSGGITETTATDKITINVQTNAPGDSGQFTAKIRATLGAYFKESVTFKIFIITMTITPPAIPTQKYHIKDPMVSYTMPDFTIALNPNINLPGVTWTYSFKYEGQTHDAPSFLGYVQTGTALAANAFLKI